MKELIDALHVIQDECRKHDGKGACETCPMFCVENDSCALTNCTPNLWEINDNIQRALL